MSLKNITTGVNHDRFERDVRKLLDKHAGKLSSQELLAISSRLVGMIMAMQNAKTMTADIATQIVLENIKLGNAAVVNKLRNSPVAGNA